MKRLFALAVLAAVVAGPSVVDAQPYGRAFGQDSYQDRRGAGQVPLSRVLQMIAARHPGRHLNTTTGDAGGRPAYYVQWQLENGRVVVFVVDAESGQILGRQGG
ncbi:PepSY domain-containing protein [Phenylobacterium sp. SCN 70-31]|uniref:PepSY domain-containing protein n=1 Tax=Phenylobacterium sp. SCN 70-31 TaxID=1660129 RepID=UPI00086E0CC4|nr:PepSY domain-containing protein [Phenylobacterium sp. SCN 70-31]ODT85102.1 MAG: hypothetical protein ABS78_21625 [Phenylobacterium sp. SCN 70-31]